MVPIMSLWLPILLSAVFVFIVSSLAHMVLPYHFKDFKKAPDEDKLMDALRGFNLAEGEYFMPFAGSREEFNKPEHREKMRKGPGVIMSVWQSASAGMMKNMVMWFVYCIVVGVFAALVAGGMLGPGADSHTVFHLAGITAFCCYTVAHWQDTIWFKRSWRRTITGAIDGLLYALVTAGTFGWLWPR